MNTIRLVPSWPGRVALWPAKHANYLLPEMYEPWNLVPDWLADLITQANDPKYVKRCVKAAGVNGLDDLSIFQAVSLLDVLLEQIRRTRETVAEADQSKETVTPPIVSDRASVERLATDDNNSGAIFFVGRWRTRKKNQKPLETQVVS